MDRIGLDNSAIRQKNLGLVLEALLTGQCKSRIDIARTTNLSKMSATNLIAELLENRFVEEKKEAPNGRGRPISILSLSPLAPKAICIHISEKGTQVSLASLNGECLRKETAGKADDIETFLPKLFDAIDLTLRSCLQEKIVGFSISCALPSFVRSGSILVAGKKVELSKELFDRYQIPCYLFKEVDALTAKEKYFGIGKEEKDYIFLQIGSELESGAVVHNELFQNSIGQGMDIAHVCIDYDGLSCPCGAKGCLGTYVSASAMEKKLREITKLKIPFSGFCELQSKKNDSRIDWAFKDMMDKLAIGITSFAHLFHPRLVIIGGEGTLIPDRYLQKLEKSLELKDENGKRYIEVVKSHFSIRDNDGGAITPLLTKVFSGEILLF